MLSLLQDLMIITKDARGKINQEIITKEDFLFESIREYDMDSNEDKK